MNSSALKSIELNCWFEYEPIIKHIKETNQPLKNIYVHNCNLSDKQFSQVVERFFIANYSLDEISIYITGTIDKAVQRGELLMPRNNNMADLMNYLFSDKIPFSTLKKSNKAFYKIIRQTVRMLRNLYTKKALIIKGTYNTANCIYDVNLCTSEVLDSFRNCFLENRPMEYISKLIKSRAQGNSYSFLIENVLPLFSDEEWIGYICSTMTKYYTSSPSKIHLGKEVCIKVLFGTSIFSQHYALKQDTRFSHILNKATYNINSQFLYVSDEIRISFLQAITSQNYLAPVIERYKEKYPRTYIHYLQDIIIPTVGEDTFLKYLKSTITRGIAELQNEYTRPIQNVSKLVLGFAMHSITKDEKFSYLKKLFYSIWFMENSDSFANPSARQKIYALLNLDNEKRRLLEKTKRGFDILQFSDCTLDDALEYTESVLYNTFVKKKLFLQSCNHIQQFLNVQEKRYYQTWSTWLKSSISKRLIYL